MSKHSIVSVVVGFLLLALVPACDDGGGGGVISCATALVGSFEGDRQGILLGHVELEGPEFEGGVFNTIFDPDDAENDIRGESELLPDGTIEGIGSLVVINGTLDLDDCTASGDWKLGDNTGTWSLEPREPAF